MYHAKKFFDHFVKVCLFLFLCAGILAGCGSGEAEAPDAAFTAMNSDDSYTFGMFVASRFADGIAGSRKLRWDYKAFAEGFRDFAEEREARLTMEDGLKKLNDTLTQMQKEDEEARWLLGEKSREEGDAYLAANRERSGVTVTSSGLQYEVVSAGSGAKPGPEDTVRVHYEGTFIDGTVFDSSYERGEPAEFPLNGIITGWIEGLQLMEEGSTYRFVIPPDLAYGTEGAAAIPPNATLIFKVELISIVK